MIRLHRTQFHNFTCATARWFGLESRVTLNNKTGETCQVGVEIFDSSGNLLGSSDKLATMPDQSMTFIDLENLEKDLRIRKSTGESLHVFSLTPERFLEGPEYIEVEPGEVFKKMGIQDHYIEHYDTATGFSSGVLYQSVPMNSSNFSSTYSFLLQAPKIFLSDERNTAFLLLFPSPDDKPPVPEEALVQVKLKSESGEDLVYWEERIPRGGLKYIDIKRSLARLGVNPLSVVNEHGFVHCEAFCDHASFVELTMNFNERLRTFDLEHSLPPIYYNLGVQGEKRHAVVEFYRSNFRPHGSKNINGNPNVNGDNAMTSTKPSLGAILQECKAHPRLERTSEVHYLLSLLIRADDSYVEQFDYSYLEVLPQMLREMHGFQESGEGAGAYETLLLNQLKAVLGLERNAPLRALASALRDAGIRDTEFRGRRASVSTKKEQKYDQVEIWAKAEGVVAAESVENVNQLQVEYSLQSGGAAPREFTDLARPETGDPWSSRMQQWAKQGLISQDEPVLTIGPRWGGEIVYFRNGIGLRGTIGLDLFSNEPDLVKVGDMHDMPFEDNHFGLIYQRNTFNKSYDIRKALDECVRVLRPGGILVSDDCLAYTDGVSEIARTNVTRLKWFVTYLQDYVDEVLYFHEDIPNSDWFNVIGQVAIKIRK